jgi:hypothetical protein
MSPLPEVRISGHQRSVVGPLPAGLAQNVYFFRRCRGSQSRLPQPIDNNRHTKNARVLSQVQISSRYFTPFPLNWGKGDEAAREDRKQGARGQPLKASWEPCNLATASLSSPNTLPTPTTTLFLFPFRPAAHTSLVSSHSSLSWVRCLVPQSPHRVGALGFTKVGSHNTVTYHIFQL